MTEHEEIKVSVIIPVYNVEKYLRQNLQSVADQTLKEIEIICVDDGSTDSSFEIVQEFAAKDPRFVAVQQKNAGAGAARNNGLRRARGEYLSFLDSDDFFAPDMLETAYNKAQETKADFVVFNSDQYNEDEKKFKQVSWVVRYAELPPYQPFGRRAMTDNIFKFSSAGRGINCLTENGCWNTICGFRSREQATICFLYFPPLPSQSVLHMWKRAKCLLTSAAITNPPSPTRVKNRGIVFTTL